jgi:hypothetical protein
VPPSQQIKYPEQQLPGVIEDFLGDICYRKGAAFPRWNSVCKFDDPRGFLCTVSRGSPEQTIVDYDISCPFPNTPDALGGAEWLKIYARLGRLQSRAYEYLFSATATLNSQDMYCEAIELVRQELEQLRTSIPEHLRPGNPFKPRIFTEPSTSAIGLRIHFAYYNTLIALSRVGLHISTGDSSQLQFRSITDLLRAARSILDLTRHVEMEPYTPTWWVVSVSQNLDINVTDIYIYIYTYVG